MGRIAYAGGAEASRRAFPPTASHASLVPVASFPLPTLLAALALAAGSLTCRSLDGLDTLRSGGSAGTGGDFAPADLEGTWRGWSEPFDPFDQRLELTLGFDAYGTASNAAGLTEYSFPSPLNGQRVDYLELLDDYDLLFTRDGRLSLDTEYRSFLNGFVYVEEYVYKDLRMNDEHDRLEGGETIEVYENGELTVLYRGWLTLDRVR